ncbi:unknown [Crocosphaera subtropica ATCC 51142]|uniref:Leucine-binding protein domain-containing protein n=1 Tax=Crocosphaera subtropica (strain ATCC 51142 / BH68) TaxID=43989 RepID=B1WTS1_CROS5|nr:ABC transporter substrate-binding protein [Crocosphaera subtropica]ACB50387.1 unknown [Crocosphaera subtropica ATCC 51142]
MSSWTCDGVPKDGKQYPGVSPHTPQTNTGPDCIICGLPKEAMEPSQGEKQKPGKTVMAGSSGSGSPSWLIPGIIAVIIIILGGGLAAFFLLKENDQSINTPTPSPLPTETTPTPTTGESVSRGDKLFLQSTPNKQAGADAFAQENWPGAVTAYATAVQGDANDPESRIYWQNAQAKQAGNPLTIAVAVPTTSSPDSAAEILRGVAKYQTEYNQSSASGRLLEVAIIDSSDPTTAPNVAQEIINTPDILGIVGYGIDPGSQAALQQYENAGVAVLSPLTSSFQDSTLKTIPINEKEDELLVNYLQAVGKTLTQYAAQQQPSPNIAIFYNSDSGYSQQLQQEIINSLPEVQGNLIEQIDISSPDFDANSAVTNLQNSGANVGILALSQNKVSQAVEIAKANENNGSPLLLMGGDELYNADILVQGGDAIAGIILAVPWSFSPTDDFAQDALQSWKGRVSWRTATAYDATKALVETVSKNPDRTMIFQALSNGITLSDSTTDFNLFNEVPLVKAVQGNEGPKGSNYQFDPLK